MRILRIISSIDPLGGGPMEGARRIDAALAERGVRVEVACLDAPDAGEFLHSYPAKVHALGPAKWGYGYTPALVPWLKANRTRFDAVIVNGLWQYHGFAAWRALAGTDTPYFVFTHGMLDPWFKREYPLKHLKKWLYWPWADYRVLRDASAVLFTSEEERLLARQSFWLYRCNEVVTSYGTAAPPDNGDELSALFLKKYPHLQHKRILLFLGRIHEKKGCDLLIAAFAQLANQESALRLVIAGPDQTGWQSDLQQQAKHLGVVDRITWPGMLQGDEKWGAYYAAEVFCLPSHQENFGIVVAEAMGCGKSVLTSNKVNIWREIESDRAGIVRDDDLGGTISGLQTWFDMSEVERRSMESAALKCFNKRFEIDRVAEDLLKVIFSRTARSFPSS